MTCARIRSKNACSFRIPVHLLSSIYETADIPLCCKYLLYANTLPVSVKKSFASCSLALNITSSPLTHRDGYGSCTNILCFFCGALLFICCISTIYLLLVVLSSMSPLITPCICTCSLYCSVNGTPSLFIGTNTLITPSSSIMPYKHMIATFFLFRVSSAVIVNPTTMHSTYGTTSGGVWYATTHPSVNTVAAAIIKKFPCFFMVYTLLL